MERSLPLHLALTVRIRRVLARTVARRAVVVVVAVVTAVGVGSVVRSAEHDRSRWDDTRPVAVAERDLQPGDVIDAGAAALREVPSAAVADAALGELPSGAVVRSPIAAGEPIVAGRLAPQGLTGVAALVPEHHRAVAIPTGPAGTPPLHPGDHVDIVALAPPTAASLATEHHPAAPGEESAEHPDGEAEAPATTLVDAALVVDVTETAVTLAVPVDLAPTVAYGATQGLIALTLVGA